jgi:small conductance mechanosensitive channel
LLKVILIVPILGYFGIETTTIVALIVGLGLAVGAMWGGMLDNLVAGAFLVFLKLFKVGDFFNPGEVMGMVTGMAFSSLPLTDSMYSTNLTLHIGVMLNSA